MDIVSRLKMFLSQNGITNSQFADSCGIPRPTLSQLLNGRNKKVSDEIFAKIHEAYPSLNIMWLMFGDGSMFVPNANNASFSKSPQVAENSKLDAGLDFVQEPAGASQTSISFDDTINDFDSEPVAKTIMPQQPSLSAALEHIARTAGRNSTVNASKETHGRRIVNIMVFYDDNSFESFTPNHSH